MFNRISLLSAFLVLAFTVSVLASETMSLYPVNDVIGVPGSNLGWGFTIESDTNYLLAMDVTFNSAAGWGDFTGYTTDLGSFVVTPGTSVSHTFDRGIEAGVGNFYIHSDAVPGSIASGFIDLTYGLFKVNPNDPNFNPDNDIISLNNVFSNPVSVTVLAPSAVPEPSTFILLGAGCCGLTGMILRGKMKNKVTS